MKLHDQLSEDSRLDQLAARLVADAQNREDLVDRGLQPRQPHSWTTPLDAAEYLAARCQLVRQEKKLDFDSRCRDRATPLEQKVDDVIRRLRKQDEQTIYNAASPRRGFAGQQHKRFAGDHFLSNRELIDQTALFDIASHLPKGAHLHIHYNACLPPSVLLDIAKGMDRMFITSDVALVPDNDFASFDSCELQFSITSPDREKPGNLFSRDYKPRQTMRFDDFLRQFPSERHHLGAEAWLLDKLCFHEEEAHGLLQTADGAWEKFNGRTRMMKGLFNYETAYRTYTRRCLQDFMRDNIQYAEIRPNFMKSNQLFTDDGTSRIDNRGIVTMIIQEVAKFQQDMASEGRYFGGLKIIYTTPRSLSTEDVGQSLEECMQFKKEWPQWIAGYDLAGQESKGRPLKDFVPEFLEFKKKCAAEGVDIPFLFHCGETLDMGTDVDGNLVDALLLGAKRIGHGYALTKHPCVMQEMKARGVCLELCPISNEVLGLASRAAGHSMYPLLANNVHCTVNSDNGALFRSTLSHDFYQVMIGRDDLGLFAWKQLALWSIQHGCLDQAEREKLLGEWELLWEGFLAWVIEKYGM
ncbi:uncharacterized protein UV8b_00681 [Ustilaginoidea virens]|uniref:adenosine deaminase n=1 Tax=Ustilaginoidea virens TaxID=1159556 RepID=A0A1B5KRG1_USTVR|nr:uncharacterized protein UV8b_00681 [Ustilaginoidea virens]QUC16440.1 hypothetical protein UV8b_00681 [Ustilaginoidea virens]GAO13340.1 hypothetical protein UVI_02013510 [Ustilaginoidea virens]